jgi:hypothetical protein
MNDAKDEEGDEENADCNCSQLFNALKKAVGRRLRKEGDDWYNASASIKNLCEEA